MSSLLEKAARAISAHRMVESGQSVLVAVSGGPDSVAMLLALDELAPSLGISISVAHLDHGFRPESADEEKFVRGVAESLSLRFVSEKARIREALAVNPANRQAAARDARYDFFERAREALGAGKVAVGHTADDQAETYLMREIRGSGVLGLAAIPPVRGVFIRPLIDVTREEVLEYLLKKGAHYVTDPTNLKPDYMRNKLRLELLPILKEYNPRVSEALCHSADILREEDAFLTAHAEEAMRSLVIGQDPGTISLDMGGFMPLHTALKRRVLRQAIRAVKGDLFGIGYGHIISSVRVLDEGATGKGLDLPGGVRIEISYGRLAVSCNAEACAPYEVRLDVPGIVEVPQACLSVESELVGPGLPMEQAGRMGAFFDMDKLGAPLTVRSRRDGDFFYPVGMTGRKKLTDYFIDVKLPRAERAFAPILACGNDVAWVVGMRQDRRFAADSKSNNIIKINARPWGSAPNPAGASRPQTPSTLNPLQGFK